jgi:aspartate/methionine/tyrosine aminotransferase
MSHESLATRTLTDRQVAVLDREYNLADGHAYRPCTSAERALLDVAPARFQQVDRRRQAAIETDYFEAFFSLGAQTLDRTHFERFPCFTASTGIEIIANYLRLNDLSVTLIEPCFDNLKDILRRHQIPLSVFPDLLLSADGEALQEFLEQISTDVLFLVSPNNPTGSTLGKANLARIIAFCSRSSIILILDTCFRFYLPEEEVYDQYKMLAESDINCILIEDTGKTWPTLEIKAPFISVSDRLVDPIARINSDFLLHISPFAIGLLTDFVRLSIDDRRGQIRAVVAENRAALNAELASTFLVPIEQPFMSVSWARIESAMPAVTLSELLAEQNVHVLPGNQFFWSDESLGDPFLRLALVRDTAMFAQAVARLGDVCRQHTPSVAW